MLQLRKVAAIKDKNAAIKEKAAAIMETWLQLRKKLVQLREGLLNQVEMVGTSANQDALRQIKFQLG